MRGCLIALLWEQVIKHAHAVFFPHKISKEYVTLSNTRSRVFSVSRLRWKSGGGESVHPSVSFSLLPSSQLCPILTTRSLFGVFMQLDVYGAVTRANIKEGGEKIISWLKLKCGVVPGDVTASYLTAVAHIIRTSGYTEQDRKKMNPPFWY